MVAVLSSAHGEAANQARAYVQISRAAKSLTFVTNSTQLLAFKLNKQDGLNLIASDEVRATREAQAALAGLALGLGSSAPSAGQSSAVIGLGGGLGKTGASQGALKSGAIDTELKQEPDAEKDMGFAKGKSKDHEISIDRQDISL